MKGKKSIPVRYCSFLGGLIVFDKKDLDMEKKYFKVYLALAALCFLFFNTCTSTKDIRANKALIGSWELEYITGPRISFEGLYPNKKPEVNFDGEANRVSGNTGCNSFNGGYVMEGGKFAFSGNMAMTKMFCEGNGERVFTETMGKVNAYKLDGDLLSFYDEDIELMRFRKKA